MILWQQHVERETWREGWRVFRKCTPHARDEYSPDYTRLVRRSRLSIERMERMPIPKWVADGYWREHLAEERERRRRFWRSVFFFLPCNRSKP